jgi:hypothetical protein
MDPVLVVKPLPQRRHPLQLDSGKSRLHVRRIGENDLFTASQGRPGIRGKQAGGGECLSFSLVIPYRDLSLSTPTVRFGVTAAHL